jgi:hypothetical protein
VVEAHGGEVAVANALGGGARIAILLPAQPSVGVESVNGSSEGRFS